MTYFVRVSNNIGNTGFYSGDCDGSGEMIVWSPIFAEAFASAEEARVVCGKFKVQDPLGEPCPLLREAAQTDADNPSGWTRVEVIDQDMKPIDQKIITRMSRLVNR